MSKGCFGVCYALWFSHRELWNNGGIKREMCCRAGKPHVITAQDDTPDESKERSREEVGEQVTEADALPDQPPQPRARSGTVSKNDWRFISSGKAKLFCSGIRCTCTSLI